MGYNDDNSVEKCYNSGKIFVKTNGGNIYAGGIAGHGGNINNCYNTGEITVKSDSENAYAGGIIGYSTGDIANVFNMGNVITNTSGEDKFAYVGGLAGYTKGGSISFGYSISDQQGTPQYTGKLIGNNEGGTFSRLYFIGTDEDFGVGNEGNSKDKVEFKSEEEMKQQSTYVDYNFDTVWQIDVQSWYPFPTLRGMTLPEQEEENTTEFAGGNGRFDNPFKVATPEHLNNVRQYADAYFIQIADIDLTAATAEGGVYYNNGSGWLPIGDKSAPFSGNYDGGGYRIIGLKSNQQGNDSTVYAGLFGYNDGIIKNIYMQDTALSASSTADNAAYAGSIAGTNHNGSIINCHNTGTVSALSEQLTYAGGIAGSNSGRIENCSNAGAVSAGESAGGIVGDSSGIIDNCYNTGAISADFSAAGIAGYYAGSIENCYNTGTITASGRGMYEYSNVGGIAGFGHGDVFKCYNAGSVTLTSARYYGYAGGIVGKIDFDDGKVENVFNTGRISAIAENAESYTYAGGLVGSATYNKISYGYNIGEVNAEGTYPYAGRVIGENYNANNLSRLYYIGVEADLGVGNEKDAEGRVEVKTAEEMKQQSTYVEFDFNTVWSISLDKNGGYPTLQGLPAPEDAGNVPVEPAENDVTITLPEKSYDEATGTYSLTVTLQNQGKESVSGTLLFAAYDDGRFVGLRKYAVELEPNGTRTIPAEIITNGKVEQLKVFCWDIGTLQPFGNAAETAG